MALISVYDIDTLLSPYDKWIGTDYNTGATKNYTPSLLANYFNQSNSIGIGGQISFKYYNSFTGGRPQESITTNLTLPSFSSLVGIKVHKNCGGGNYCINILSYFSGGDILISNTSNQNKFGHFKFVSIIQDVAEPNFYNLMLEYVGGNGGLEHLNNYSIRNYTPNSSGVINTIDLQQVTDNGNVTTNGLIIDYLQTGGDVVVGKTGAGGRLVISDGNLGSNIALTASLATGPRTINLPDDDGTVALLSDIPSLSGYVPTSRTLTINGTSYNLSANRSWTIPVATGDMTKAVYDTNNDGIVDKAQAMVTPGRNSTGAILYKGTIVYISGATGQLPNFVKAQANIEATSAGTFGAILQDIPNNSNGYAVTLGLIDPLDTRTTAPNPITDVTLAVGDTLYLHPTVAGYVTNVKPSAPNHLVYVGKVVNIGPDTPNGGAIVFRIQNGYEIEELHNVAISSVANNEVLTYDTATSLWKNKSVINALGYTPENQANKSDSYTASSSTTYASTKALVDGLATKQTAVSGAGFVVRDLAATSIIGNATYQILASVQIPANTFLPSQEFKIEAARTVISPLTTSTIRLYLNTANNLTGAVQIGTFSTTINTYVKITRQPTIRGGQLRISNATGSLQHDNTSNTSVMTTVAYDVTQTYYILFTSNVSSGSDTLTNEFLVVRT